MKAHVLIVTALAIVFGTACSHRHETMPTQAPEFFATAPKAERAFLSAYGSETLNGKCGVRIEMEPLSFVDSAFARELEPEILLERDRERRVFRV